MNDNTEKNIAPPPHPGTSLQRNEPLPVLAAFNDFIKEEQRKSRNRIIVMGLFFTFIIIVIITAGILISTTYYNQVQSDLRQTKADLDSVHIKSEVNKDLTKEKVAHIQEIANNIAKTIEQQQTELTNLSRKTKKKQNNLEINKMRKVVKVLSDKNKSLQKDTDFAKTKIPELTKQIQELQNMVANLSENTNAKQQPTSPTKPVKIKQYQPIKKKIISKPAHSSLQSNAKNKIQDKNVQVNIPSKDGNIMLLIPIPK